MIRNGNQPFSELCVSLRMEVTAIGRLYAFWFVEREAAHRGPQQDARRKGRPPATVTGLPQVPFKTQGPAGITLDGSRRGPAHRFCCLRRKANSRALAVRTSARACLNCRPASTRWRTSSTHCSGMRSTRFLPWSMNVSVQIGWPSPWAHRQLAFPHRRCVNDNDPGNASAGIRSSSKALNVRCRKRAASFPLGFPFICR